MLTHTYTTTVTAVHLRLWDLNDRTFDMEPERLEVAMQQLSDLLLVPRRAGLSVPGVKELSSMKRIAIVMHANGAEAVRVERRNDGDAWVFRKPWQPECTGCTEESGPDYDCPRCGGFCA